MPRLVSVSKSFDVWILAKCECCAREFEFCETVACSIGGIGLEWQIPSDKKERERRLDESLRDEFARRVTSSDWGFHRCPNCSFVQSWMQELYWKKVDTAGCGYGLLAAILVLALIAFLAARAGHTPMDVPSFIPIPEEAMGGLGEVMSESLSFVLPILGFIGLCCFGGRIVARALAAHALSERYGDISQAPKMPPLDVALKPHFQSSCKQPDQHWEGLPFGLAVMVIVLAVIAAAEMASRPSGEVVSVPNEVTSPQETPAVDAPIPTVIENPPDSPSTDSQQEHRKGLLFFPTDRIGLVYTRTYEPENSTGVWKFLQQGQGLVTVAAGKESRLVLNESDAKRLGLLSNCLLEGLTSIVLSSLALNNDIWNSTTKIHSLRELVIRDCTPTEDTLDKLAEFKNLKSLSIRGVGLESNAETFLKENLPGCEVFISP